jgi:hypothetical protein
MQATEGKISVRFLPQGVEDWVEYKWVDSRDVVLRPVEDKDIKRFPEAWSAYTQAKPSVPVNGTALTDLPGIKQEQAILIRIKGVSTVEQLAGLDDFAAVALGDQGIMWRDVAKLALQAKATQATGTSGGKTEQRKAA